MIIAKSNAGYPSAEADPELTPPEPFVIEDEGKATEVTHGCCGVHGEIGFPPFNTHA